MYIPQSHSTSVPSRARPVAEAGGLPAGPKEGEGGGAVPARVGEEEEEEEEGTRPLLADPNSSPLSSRSWCIGPAKAASQRGRDRLPRCTLWVPHARPGLAVSATTPNTTS